MEGSENSKFLLIKFLKDNNIKVLYGLGKYPVATENLPTGMAGSDLKNLEHAIKQISYEEFVDYMVKDKFSLDKPLT